MENTYGIIWRIWENKVPITESKNWKKIKWLVKWHTSKIIFFIRVRQSSHIKSIERVIRTILSPTLFYDTIYAIALMFYMSMIWMLCSLLLKLKGGKIDFWVERNTWSIWIVWLVAFFYRLYQNSFFCNINIKMPFWDISLVKIEYTVLLLLHHPHQSHGH